MGGPLLQARKASPPFKKHPCAEEPHRRTARNTRKPRGATEKTLKKEALDQYLDGGRKESSVVTQVTNGKNAMPAFGGRLSDEEIGDVAAYVIDQANGDKWDE